MVETKKRILIFSHAMELGGAERVLLGLLEAIDTEQYDVDLFLMRHEGELLKDIPDKIHLLPEIPQYTCLAVPIKRVLKRRQIGVAFGRFLGKKKARRRRRELDITGENDVALEFSHKYTVAFMPEVGDGIYDVAISFLTPHYYVRDRVKAKKKIAWIHTDYSVVSVDRESQLKMWAAYDHIISISDQVTDSFLKTFPELANKVEVLPHFMPVEYIKRKANEEVAHELEPKENCIKLLSIGRFCYQKNFDNVPDICRRILETGLHVKWYLIGYGGDELIRKRIIESSMEDHVFILGKKENPYPYIKSCDVYVQPSRYEGRSVCVIEAQILGKPVVITDFPTSDSQLENGVDGIIVPLDNEGCADGIAKVLSDKALLERVQEYNKMKQYDNTPGIQRLYSLFEKNE